MVQLKVLVDLDIYKSHFGARDLSIITDTFNYLNVDKFLFSYLYFQNLTVYDLYSYSSYLVILFLSTQG